jgi:ABC-type nitrate/sulfonate/bicarbonate transport system ATPase subunit
LAWSGCPATTFLFSPQFGSPVQPDRPAAVVLSGISKHYVAGGTPVAVLEGLDLSIEAGAFVSLLGPSGVGKSTVLNLVAGLEAPDRGSIQVDGWKNGSGAPPPIAYMQQRDLLLPWRTVWENILLGPELRGGGASLRSHERAHRLLGEFGLEGFAKAWPAELSGGMRQRVALIRTLLCDHPVLLLDEPFGALDSITRGRLQRHLARLWREWRQTVLLVTHDVEEALLLSTRILLLEGPPGRIMEDIALTPGNSTDEGRLRMRTHILKRLDTLAPVTT